MSHRFTRTGHFELRRLKPEILPRRRQGSGAAAKAKRCAVGVGLFVFFAVWVGFGLQPLRHFRVAPDRTLASNFQKLEHLAQTVARGTEPSLPPVMTIVER